MRQAFALLFSVLATCVSAQDLIFKNTSGLFNNQIALNELLSIDHSADANGNGTITLRTRNGGVYTSPADGVTAKTNQIDSVLTSGRFASMERVKTFDKISDLEFGDFIGVFNEDDYNLTEFHNAACWEYGAIDATGTFMKLILYNDSLRATTFATNNNTSVSNLRIRVSDIVYVGQDKNGEKVPLSARLVYLYDITGNKLSLTNYYIDNHPTIFVKDTEPTRTFAGYTPVPTCCNGYLVIQPDLIGYGASFERTQMYIDIELNGSAIAYSVVAAQQFAEWAAQREQYSFTMASSASIINAGASQGATSALAGTYYIENKIDKTKYPDFPSISDTRVCAGAYDLKLCWNEFCAGDTTVYACKIPMMLASALTHYPEYFGAYNVHDIFSDDFNNYVYTDPATGESYSIWDMLDLKAYSSETIEAVIYAACPSEGTSLASFSKMLAPDIFKSDGTVNWSCAKMAGMGRLCDASNFTDPNVWKPQSAIHMLHATNDAIIPYCVSEEFYNNQSSNTSITFTTLSSVPDMSKGAVGSHLMTCVIWYLSEITGTSTTLLNEMFKMLLSSSN